MSRGAVLAAVAALLLPACATAPAGKPGEAPFAALAARFAGMAKDSEQAGDLRAAARQWRVVASVNPGDAQAGTKAASLDAEASKRAAAHLARGADYLTQGSTDAARKEFVLALLLEPDGREALDYLKVRLAEDAVPYTVSAGETLEGIAGKQYGDPRKAAVIAAVNGLARDAVPAAGRILQLPLPDREAGAAAEAAAVWNPETEEKAAPEEAPAAAAPTPAPKTPGEQALAKAQAFHDAGSFREAVAAAALVPRDDPAARPAADLAARSLWALAEKLVSEEKYGEAIETYRRIDPARKDVKGAVAAAERKRREKAEEHYLKGVRLSVDQNLAGAIVEWEATLSLNPDHPKARKDIEKAKALQEKLKGIQ